MDSTWSSKVNNDATQHPPLGLISCPIISNVLGDIGHSNQLSDKDFTIDTKTSLESRSME